MSKSRAGNLPASVRQRLLNIAKARGERFDLILGYYAVERFLYRLAEAGYADRFVVKGAMLFTLWTGMAHRSTRDLDLLGFGDMTADTLARLVRELCRVTVEPDGIELDPESVRVEPIRAGDEYAGQRVRVTATLSGARIPLQVDVGVGDVVTPPPEEIEYPGLLDAPVPRVRVYRKETVIAEKLHAMVDLGAANSRMKDFYDVWTMSREFPFDSSVLGDAIRATFERRRTPIPRDPPVALREEFAHEPGKREQWAGFLRRHGLGEGGLELRQVIENLSQFLMPLLGEPPEAGGPSKSWAPGGPWVTAEATHREKGERG